MSAAETEHQGQATLGDGRVAAGPAGGSGTSAADRREPATAAADSTASTGTDAEAGHSHAGPGVSADASGEPDAPGAEEVTEPAGVTDQEFDLAVDVNYHRARASWFAAQHRLFLFGTIMAGSAAATDVSNAKVLGLAAAALGTLDLVLDPTTRMVEHRDHARDTLAIVADLHRNSFSPEARLRAKDEDFRLSANEGAPFNALRTMAFNQAITAFGRPDDYRVWVPPERRLLANLLRFEGWQDVQPGRLGRWWRKLRGHTAQP